VIFASDICINYTKNGNHVKYCLFCVKPQQECQESVPFNPLQSKNLADCRSERKSRIQVIYGHTLSRFAQSNENVVMF